MTRKNKDPYAVQIGARIKQVREMAGYKIQQELNSQLVERFNWSTGRLSNYEAGQSRAGPEEVTVIAELTDSSACWIMFGAGPIRAHERDIQAIRNQNLVFSVAQLKATPSAYRAFLKRADTNDQALSKFLDNPFKKIGVRQARALERSLGKEKGWLDAQHVDHDPVCSQFPDDMRELMSIFSELPSGDKQKLLSIARVLTPHDKVEH